MSRWASQLGLSIAALVLALAFAALSVYLILAGLAFAGVAVLLGLGILGLWALWRSRANHAWR